MQVLIKRPTLTVLTAALLSSCVIPGAMAQIVNPARPEFIERQHERDTRPALGGAGGIVLQDEKAQPAQAGLKFELKSVEFDGLGTFTEEDLKSIYADELGKTITVGELYGIASEITAYYRNNGYILTRAILPPQRIAGGNVKIRIVEGFVSNVRIEGDIGSDSSHINDYAQKIKESKPLNAKTLERYLLLMEDLPGVEARAVLRPSPDTPGASEVVVNVTRKPVEFSASLDNRGTRFLGQYQAAVTTAVNDLFGRDDQTQLRLISTIFQPDELKYIDLRHEEQLGSDGLKFVVSGNYVDTNPGASLEPLDIEGMNALITAGLEYPIMRSRQSNWFVNTEFSSRWVDVDTLGTALYHDELRVLSLGTSYDFVDSTHAVNRMETAISQGLSWGTGMDGAEPRSRASGETSFTKITAEASRLQPIDGPWSAYGAVTGQYGFDALLAAEEFAIGGQEFGSAYDPAELTGDSGVAARLELQYNQSPGYNYLDQYQLYGFYDIGRIWNRDIVGGSEFSHASLASTGLGARFNMNTNWSGGLEGTVPLTRDVAANGSDGSAPRVFFNLQYRY